ncbi:MAG TPA: phosphoenolpyruvate carboxylase [Streptosporangiaceae bacterium]|nr:phosphoenolpyruvate carboxylase [Streptosporangiaceae bacterium]
MRRDVRLLGGLLGEVLREYGGQELLDDVETLRHAVIRARLGGETAPSPEEIARLVASWPLDRAELVARAFTVYFHLANLAEEHQRIRALRERDTGQAPLRESLAAAVAEIRAGQGEEHLRELLASLRVHPVLTAHPTEARRRAVVAALRRISVLLGVLDDPRGGAAEREEARRGLREQIDVLWRTSHLRVKPMDPIDEVRSIMAAFDETLFRVVPVVYRSLDHALAGPDSGCTPTAVPAFLRFGSWVGADRDGNPTVTARVTREAAIIQADHALRALEQVTGRIGRALTLHEDTTPPSAQLRSALAAAAAAHPELAGEIAARSPAEPHRAYLLLAAERLRATRLRHADLAYPGPADFLADLRLVQDSLAGAGARRQAFGELQHLIWQAETFGFHLAELEVRQHSAVHARALAELRAADACRAAGHGEHAAQAGHAGQAGHRGQAGHGGHTGPLSAETEELLATFRVMAWIQSRFGTGACHRYVVSFTRSADDIAAVYELARRAMPDGGGPVLDVVPLFESGEDLANAPRVLTEMLALPPVAQRLAANGRQLEAMLGYSDSAKELGPVSATLRLFDAQASLAAWAAAHDVQLTIFHGRGGALGRGGGPAGRAVLAQAPGSVAGRLKVTEQGEVIFARYGQLAIAQRHLEQVTSAVLLASAPAVAERTTAASARFRQVAQTIEAAARHAFRSLVETDGFAEWFARISPLEEISRLRIGSRPARRGLAGTPAGLDDLRAIPWVFAWSQTRVNLPGWFGLGSGLAAVAEPGGARAATGGPAAAYGSVTAAASDDGPGTAGDGGPGDGSGLETLRRAYREWPLLAVLLDNAEMSLAKTDATIAARYLALGGRDDLTRRVLAEYDLTRRLVLAVTGHDRLLAQRPVLSRAVALRDPYVDALSHLQLRALAALRNAAGDDPGERERLERLLLLTVNGVAAGLQNTG